MSKPLQFTETVLAKTAAQAIACEGIPQFGSIYRVTSVDATLTHEHPVYKVTAKLEPVTSGVLVDREELQSLLQMLKGLQELFTND